MNFENEERYTLNPEIQQYLSSNRAVVSLAKVLW